MPHITSLHTNEDIVKHENSQESDMIFSHKLEVLLTLCK